MSKMILREIKNAIGTVKKTILIEDCPAVIVGIEFFQWIYLYNITDMYDKKAKHYYVLPGLFWPI